MCSRPDPVHGDLNSNLLAKLKNREEFNLRETNWIMDDNNYFRNKQMRIELEHCIGQLLILMLSQYFWNNERKRLFQHFPWQHLRRQLILILS